VVLGEAPDGSRISATRAAVTHLWLLQKRVPHFLVDGKTPKCSLKKKEKGRKKTYVKLS
jgi:hypothetical protein